MTACVPGTCREEHIHFVQLALRTTSNLLCPELDELLLQVVELLPQLLLVLPPELRRLDFAGRLCEIAIVSNLSVHRSYQIYHLTILRECPVVSRGYVVAGCRSRCLQSRSFEVHALCSILRLWRHLAPRISAPMRPRARMREQPPACDA